MQTDLFTRLVLCAVAGLFSLLVLVILHAEGVSSGLLLVLLSSALWYLAVWVTRPRPVTRHLRPGIPVLYPVGEPAPEPLQHYLMRLLGNLDQCWHAFRQHFQHTEKSLHNVAASLDKALNMAQNTGMLATNVMMAAATCGETGRGFASVSQDLVDISERSNADLLRLRQLVQGLAHELTQLGTLLEHPLDFWIVTSAGLPLAELVKVRSSLETTQQQLRTLAERYRRSPQLDVRWLQLGDAVKRLLNELINTLFQLELHLDDVLSDMRLLKLAEGSDPAQQIVEIKDRIHSNREPGGPVQKFIQ